jgi:adenylate kinase family enzyme
LVVRAETAVSTLRRRGRGDDSASAITRRFHDYEQATVPVLDWFTRHTMLAYVDGDRSPDVVADDLFDRLGINGRDGSNG